MINVRIDFQDLYIHLIVVFMINQELNSPGILKTSSGNQLLFNWRSWIISDAVQVCIKPNELQICLKRKHSLYFLVPVERKSFISDPGGLRSVLSGTPFRPTKYIDFLDIGINLVPMIVSCDVPVYKGQSQPRAQFSLVCSHYYEYNTTSLWLWGTQIFLRNTLYL